jgi:WD40 repeat protein
MTFYRHRKVTESSQASNILELLDNPPSPEQWIRAGDVSMPATSYDTITHAGLKSCSLLSASGIGPTQSGPAPDAGSLSLSNHFTIPRKPCPPPRPKSRDQRAANEQDLALPKLKSAIPYLRSLEGYTYWVWSVAFSPHGDWLASASGDDTLRVWNAKTGYVMRTECIPTGLSVSHPWIWTVTFSPQHVLVASVSKLVLVRISNMSTGTPLE